MMKPKNLLYVSLFLLIAIFVIPLKAQQISISRINEMPDMPQPFLMRNWKKVAQLYDSTVFNQDWQGEYLPVVFFRDQSVNYPGQPSFGLHTTIGTVNPNSGEAINVIPAVVGASLAGIDKSNQFGHNWAAMCQDYFNKREAENIYLNHPSSSSGNDWWYETMPNIFYLQLRWLYPEIAVFDEQLETMASQWMRAVSGMEASATPWTVPYMNYRAWNMSTMSPLDAGVPEPEAAGAIAWILYQTYKSTGKEEYRIAAELSLDYLNSLETNPSYELQLPYGVYTAARLNAEKGSNYNIEKMINWVFDRGPLRGWGTIAGKWGDYDCHGLVGEANDQGNDYAFMMNGYQQAAALLPMLRYDDRFATAISKWTLNLANASRLFYPEFMPENSQDNFDWAQQNDPNSVIAYEALKEKKNGQSPYATGDGVDGGWSQTNLMLYGSSHVGYLGSLIEKTNVEGILQLDLLKTDFYHDTAYPTYLYYNPYETAKSVILELPQGNYSVYDMISNGLIAQNQSGSAELLLPAKAAIMPVIIPADAVLTQQKQRTLANMIVIDYNNGVPVSNFPPRIRALMATDSVIEINQTNRVYCTAEDIESENLTYFWWIDGQGVDAATHYDFSGNTEKTYLISCKVTDGEGLSDSTSISVKVVDKVAVAPEIKLLKAHPRKAKPGESAELTVLAEDANNDELSYEWTDLLGNEIGLESSVLYQVSENSGDYWLYCKVTDTDGLFDRDSLQIMVRAQEIVPSGDIIAQYLLEGNADDQSVNQLDGTPNGGVSWVIFENDPNTQTACLNGSTANIVLPASPLFDFTEAISISLRFKIEAAGANEQFLVSHGSWQNRYKISLSDNRIRFTLNTTDGIVDLDSETKPEIGTWYNLAVIYDGADMEIWLNGALDAFTNHSGAISSTVYQPVLGQQFPRTPAYNFNGCLDNVSFYNYALDRDQIFEAQYVGIESYTVSNKPQISLFPNPLSGKVLYLKISNFTAQPISLSISDAKAQLIYTETIDLQANSMARIDLKKPLPAGIYFCTISSSKETAISKFISIH
ncbi:MAG: T9SS type A sorting domain-containing protein [Bacteroidales bacterium]|nr:T9SS type A sorting domain-containing protein [Bacteroidales bacterium]